MTFHHPLSGPSCGGTAIVINGFGFKPFDGTSTDPKTGEKANKLYIRYLDYSTQEVISPSTLIDQDSYTSEKIRTTSVP